MNNYYQLYTEAVLTLAETIVVKFDDAAQALNFEVRDLGYPVDDSDKASWKYYQNISGQYHFTDQIIQVTSLDTGELIDFTKANLEIHLATRAAYAFGNRRYKELVQNHPGQELLILGLLNPTPIQQAIDAVDGTILRYPAELVESNERSFIPKLQKWIYQYLERWVNSQYTISDDLYVATYIGQFFMHLVQAMFAFRLEACKTSEAHSFHVRQYLASHGELDVYLDKMTQSQALFFYRNINYIQRHAGKRDTFDWLVEQVMSARHLPLYEYTMNHNVGEMGRESIDDNDPLHLLPSIEFKRTGVNSYATETDIEKYTLDRVLEKVNPLAPGNPQYNTDHQEDMRNAFAYSKSSVSVTKMLESSVTDYSDAAVYPLASALLNHWLGLVGKGLYVANVVVQMPASGDTLQLAAQDAVALYLYAMHKTAEVPVGVEGYAPLVYVPKYKVERLTRTVLPPLTELLSITERGAMTVEEVQEIYDTAVPVTSILAIQSFYNFGVRVANAQALQHAIYASKEDFLARGDAQYAVSRLYDDDVLTLQTLKDPQQPDRGIPYVRFFQALGIDIDHYTQNDYYNLATEIVAAATGVKDKPDNSLGELQRAMVALFMQLSSYSIQVITEINASNIVVVENPAIRVSTTHAVRAENFHEYVDGAPIHVIKVQATENQRYTVPLARIAEPTENEFTNSYKQRMDITSRIRQLESFHPITPYQIRSGLEINTSFDFEESVKNLTEAQRNDLVDVYQDFMDDIVENTSRSFRGFTFISNYKQINQATYINWSKQLNNFTPLRTAKTLNGFALYSFTRQIKVISVVSHTKELDLFDSPAGAQFKTLAGFTAFVDPKKALPGFTPIRVVKQLAAVKMVGKTKQLPATVMVGRTKELGAFSFLRASKQLPVKTALSTSKQLAGFTNAGGHLNSDDLSGIKDVTGF